MAIIPFTQLDRMIEGIVLSVSALATGDESRAVNINNGDVDISVQLFGTVGGSTVTVQGSLDGTQFNTLDDGYGVTMSYTALGICKPVGPAVCHLKIVVTGGTGVSVNALIHIVRKTR